MARLEYTITQDIIDSGCGNTGDSCPNYHAAVDAILALGYSDCWFGYTNLYLKKEGRFDGGFSSPPVDYQADTAVTLPLEVQRWIDRFDEHRMAGDPLPVMTFAFDIPDVADVKTREELIEEELLS